MGRVSVLTLALGFLGTTPALVTAAAVRAAAGPARVPAAAALAARSVDCVFSVSATVNITCLTFASEWDLTLAQFEELNPNATCPTLDSEGPYCVIGTVAGDGASSASATTVGPQRSVATLSYTLPTGTVVVTSTDISFPPIPTTTSTTTSTTATSTTTIAATSTTVLPHPTQTGLTADCTIFHEVVKGDTCPSIETQFGITADEFFAWNPAITTNCIDLFVNYYVCVGVAGAASTSMSTSAPTTAETTTSTSTSVPTTAKTTTTAASAPSPTQPGTISTCTTYHLVVSGDTCAAIESAAGITSTQFFEWNTGIDTTCDNIYLGYYVCVGVAGSTTSPTTATTTTTTIPTTTAVAAPSPTQPGTISTCTTYHLVVSGDTCAAIESAAGITSTQFFEWNTGIDTTCDNIYLGYYVCIGVTGSATTSTKPTATTTAAAAPSPTQPGTVSTCTAYHLVVSGDTCAAIESAAGITSAQFLTWNTGIDSTCDNIYLGYYVCIGVGSTATTTKVTATTTAVAAPSPTQPGTISTCKTYHLVVSGDTCAAIESAAGITSAQFLTWNTDIDTNCDNIYLGYYVCIGV
ncbi:hypothetical protein SCUCBS95973_001632 [Sporothrix curviconia]|uniref:LysM domain-containing protein n=1 Tax=Sporothrix curviconia TaxID=1260050 RepID=A0ABP0B0V4_9PEZI